MGDKSENLVVSFGFSKTSEKKLLQKSDLNEHETKKSDADYITSLEGCRVKSVKPKEEKKELVIPLIKSNNWRTQHDSAPRPDRTPPADAIDSQAVQEILRDSLKQNENWESRGTVDTNLQIPLLMQNAVPEGYETDDRLDVSLRPDEPEETDFDEVPIEAFGIAMLRGMGWKPGTGIGKNSKAIAPVEAVLRPKGMGLGADRKQAQNLNSSKQGPVSGTEENEDLILKKGTCCLIEKGPNKDLYGMIEGIDEDNARVMVKLTVSGKSVTVSQYNMKLVTRKEYDKYSKYLNKGSADRYKEKEKKKEKHSQEKYRDRESDSERERKHRKEDRRSADRDDRKYERQNREKDQLKERGKDKRDRKRKHDDDRSHGSRSSPSYSSHSNGHASQSSGWVKPHLRVRIIEENFKKGKYFNTKVVVVDVPDRDHCVCKTDDGKVLSDVSSSMLETVIPRSDSSYICIVTGKHKGQLGQVLERDKKRGEALVQLLSDRDKVLQLDFDSVCEYVGDVSEEFDY